MVLWPEKVWATRLPVPQRRTRLIKTSNGIKKLTLDTYTIIFSEHVNDFVYSIMLCLTINYLLCLQCSVRKLSKMTEKLSKSLLNGVGIVSGSVMAPVVKSQPGKAFLKMLPGEVLLASLDAVSK